MMVAGCGIKVSRCHGVFAVSRMSNSGNLLRRPQTKQHSKGHSLQGTAECADASGATRRRAVVVLAKFAIPRQPSLSWKPSERDA